MNFGSRQALGLLVQGAGARLVVAVLVVMLLWAGFLWATATPGAL
ncbi:MAG: hypothetical protein AAF160_00550 [Pseudomonadota bacterium]